MLGRPSVVVVVSVVPAAPLGCSPLGPPPQAARSGSAAARLRRDLRKSNMSISFLGSTEAAETWRSGIGPCLERV